MGYTIELGTGTDQLILDANFLFDLDFNLEPSGSGLASNINVNIVAEGDVVAATASAVIDKIVDLSEEITEKAEARRVVIKLDGTTKYDFQVSDAFGTPIVTRFRVTTQDEGGESHLHWVMGIFIQMSGGGGQGGDTVINLRTSYTIVKENGVVIKKIWRAACQAASAATAETKVRSFAPSEERITEAVTRYAQEAKADGEWVWEKQKHRKEQFVFKETLEITGGGADWIGGPRVAAPGTVPPDPILHEKLRTEQIAIVRGVVRGYVRTLEPPAAHWQETDTMKRALAREVNYDTVPADDFFETGVYERQYMEVWIATGGVPAAEHGDHFDVLSIPDPPTGPIKNR